MIEADLRREGAKSMTETVFVCPHCGQLLRKKEDARALVCPIGHSYDVSREGYVNLLLRMTRSAHGDNREMLLARRAFLEGGYYAPLASAAGKLLCARLEDGARILDAGCGEGYYTEAIAEAMRTAGKRAELFGVDISREAVRLCAKRACAPVTAVASLYELPIADGSFDALVCFFSPQSDAEFHRVLKDGGYLLMAVPDARHLYGMKRVLYDTPYENEVKDPYIEGFRLIDEVGVSDVITLRLPSDIAALFSMTPYYYRTPREGHSRLSALDTLETEIAFRLFLYEKPAE